AIGREDAQPPIADLVAEALHNDRAIRRQHARVALLLGEVVDEVARGALVEVRLAHDRVRRLVDSPARERPYRLAQLARPADAVALPERDRSGHARRGGDDHAVAADLLDPPGRS